MTSLRSSKLCVPVINLMLTEDDFKSLVRALETDYRRRALYRSKYVPKKNRQKGIDDPVRYVIVSKTFIPRDEAEHLKLVDPQLES